ncbi:MAG: VCBS repeat-containing protein [Armatimonadota bacterium]|jgi:hypothetical protein
MVPRGVARGAPLGLALLGLSLVTSAAFPQERDSQAADELRLNEIRRAFWALTDAIASVDEGAAPDAAIESRIRIVPALCREFLLDFPDSGHAVRVRWLLGRAWALARADALRATDALEGAVLAHLSNRDAGTASLAGELARLGVVTPRAEGDWSATTRDIDGDGAADVVLAYSFGGLRAPLGGFCSLLRREGDRWTVQRLFGPARSLASAMPDVPMAPRSHEVRDLDGDGRREVLLHCQGIDRPHGLLLAFGIRGGQMQRLLWADCPDGDYQVVPGTGAWPEIAILRRFGTPEDTPDTFRRRERHYFAFDGRRYAFQRTRREPATYLYEQFWEGRLAYDASEFQRAAQALDRAASDTSSLKLRPAEGANRVPARPARYASAGEERHSYRATARYFAGLAWAHVGEVEKARRAMDNVVNQHTYVKGVSASGEEFLPGFWAKRFNARYKRSTDLYAALAQVAPTYALWLYLTDHPPEDPVAAILNAAVRTDQALVTDVTGDGRGDVIVALPAVADSGRSIVVLVRTEEAWRTYAVAGDPEARAEERRGAPRGVVTLCGLGPSSASPAQEAADQPLVGQVADFDGDGAKDIEIKGAHTMRIRWTGRTFALVESDEESAAEPEPAASPDEARRRDLASLDQIQDAIYDGEKFEPALTWLDTLEGRLRAWEDRAAARALLAEVAYHRALCHAHLGRWHEAARTYTLLAERYLDLAWTRPGEARARALPGA